MTQSTHFLLVPDRAAARRVRRLVAERLPRLGVRVGTWGELLEALRGACLLPKPPEDFRERVAHAAAQGKDAFWSESFKTAPDETTAVLAGELTRLLENLPPGEDFAPDTEGEMEGRGQRHLLELVALSGAMGPDLRSRMPSRLGLEHDLLAAPLEQARPRFTIYIVSDTLHLTPIQQALVARLESAQTEVPDPALSQGLRDGLTWTPVAKAPPSLAALQRHLFAAAPGKPAPLDDAVQWVAARDPLEEVEVCAGMIQQALAKDKKLSPADIALLLPEDATYAPLVRDVFARCGLPTAGLEVSAAAADLGAEWVRGFLLACRKPAPYMAVAALLSHPLMPWDARMGHDLAMAAMGGEREYKAWNDLPKPQKDLLAEISRGASTPAVLRIALEKLEAVLPRSGRGQDENKVMAAAASRARVVLEAVHAVLAKQAALDWGALLDAARATPVSATQAGPLTREGIAVFNEGEEPWRPVRQLFVLGFNEGHYPADILPSAIFSEADVAGLRRMGHALLTAEERQGRLRERFRRHLCTASERATFLLSRRDLLGEALHPSGTLVFMPPLYGLESMSDLLQELDRTEHRAWVHGLATVKPGKPKPPRELEMKDLALKRDLLALGKGHQSPSRLDTLMTSPLGWLLNALGLEPRAWAPEELDVMLQGTLAHQVFERLFNGKDPIPAANTIEPRARPLLEAGIREHTPFLDAPEWRVERELLESEIALAAIQWSVFLQGVQATILAEEAWLNGQMEAPGSIVVPLKGRSDLLFKLPDGRLYVVDYKKSSSSKRRKQMENGYDLQASLYRLMLETGDYSDDHDTKLREALKGRPEIGVMYYLMNDRQTLADTAGWLPDTLASVAEMDTDVSQAALAKLNERLMAVKKGRVELNREGDKKTWDKLGVGFYAPDAHPLVALFQHEDESDAIEKEEAE